MAEHTVGVGANHRLDRRHISAALAGYLTRPERGRSGPALCSRASNPVPIVDQSYVDHDAQVYGMRHVVVADLPLCKTCERIARQVAGLLPAVEVRRG